MLYSCNTYPLGAIGEAHVLWKANGVGEVVESNECQLWLWTHPSCYLLVWHELHKALGSTAGDQQTPAKVGSVTVTSLKDQLCRFRLTGPVSLSVLQRVLQQSTNGCAAYTKNKECANNDIQRETSCRNSEVPWWTTYYSSDAMQKCYLHQWQYWTLCGTANSPAQLQPFHVLALTVSNPRLAFCSLSAIRFGRYCFVNYIKSVTCVRVH